MDNSQQLLGFVCDVRFIHWNRYSDTALTVVAECGIAYERELRIGVSIYVCP